MQDKILQKDDDYSLIMEEEFNDMLTNLELDRVTRRIAEDEMKHVQAELRERNDRDKGASFNKHLKTNMNSRGVARYYSLCKNARMPERKSTCPTRTCSAKIIIISYAYYL